MGVGGILGETWMSGLLAGAQETTGTDFPDADAFVRTSAESIVAPAAPAGDAEKVETPAPGAVCWALDEIAAAGDEFARAPRST